MKRIMIVLSLSSILILGCRSSKVTSNNTESKTEVVNQKEDPIMSLLLSGLIILSVNFLFTK
jgi:uncharacterized protein YcfL